MDGHSSRPSYHYIIITISHTGYTEANRAHHYM